MSATATDILNAVKAQLAGLYPDVPVKESKRRAADGRHMEAGWQEGFPSTCFVVSCSEAEEIDRVVSFTHICVGYPVVIELVKPAQAVVTNAPNSGSPTVVEDPDVRDKRQALRRAFYKPRLTGVSEVFDVRHRTRPAYERMSENAGRLVISGEQFTYMAMETRP